MADGGTGATVEDWWAAVAAEFDVADVAAPERMDLVLDLASDVAHGVARPAAPLTAFLVGAAVGRGVPMDEAVRRVHALLPPEG